MEGDNNDSFSEDGGDKTEATTKKRTRGPAKLDDLEDKDPFSLEWDTTGCPTGQYAVKFANYCGKRVRHQVDINLNDWDKDVDIGIKNLLWEDIKENFLINDRHKDFVLSSCGTKWRSFKSKLSTRCIRNKHPKYDSPADCYSFIEPAAWEKFKQTRDSNEFKEKSRKAIESVKHNGHPHVMGRRGYNLRVPEWIAKECSKSSSSQMPSNSLIIDRSWRWVKGRTKSDGDIPNEKTKEVSEQMCHQQIGSTESGYYVMRHMLDVVRHYRNIKDPNKWFGSEVGYIDEEINEVRELWATYFMDNYL